METSARRGLHSFLAGKAVEEVALVDELTALEVEESENKLGEFLGADRKSGKVVVDGTMQGIISRSASEVISSNGRKYHMLLL